jgi:enoyl-CoA hydratase/carnithine racemase
MGALTLTLDERLDESDVRALLAAMAAGHDADALVLQGVPGRFCLGMDFGGASRPVNEEALAGFRRGLELFADLLHAVLCFPRPTLAVVDGPALGGGLGLLAACDMVIATERARFGLPEALYGLAPAIIRPALLTRVSPQKVRLLLMSCHSRSAEEAATLGLADDVVPLTELERATRAALRQLRRANGRSVAACRRWDADALARGLRAGVDETAAAVSDPEVLAAVRAFDVEEALPWRT